MADYLYVDDEAGARKMQAQLRAARAVSIDLEADSYHHYGEKISLLQICGGSGIFIVDPFGVDLAFLSLLLEDASREKVFHDIDYDGRMLLTTLGVRPVPVFDTMIAARILGKERVGLADLLAEYFGVAVDKGLRKADWSQRPLSDDMLAYAALDVAYLLPLRERLAEDIEAVGRTDWAREEFARVVEGLEPMPEKRVVLEKVKGARDLSPRQLAVLRELLEWREAKARSRDLPTFKVVGTERLLGLAQAHPRSRRDLEAAGVISQRQAARFGKEILAAINRGMEVPAQDLPQFPAAVRHKRDLAAERILRKLKLARDSRAEELGLDPGFLLSNASLKALSRLKPRSMAEIEGSGILRNWQLKAMGDSLLRSL